LVLVCFLLFISIMLFASACGGSARSPLSELGVTPTTSPPTTTLGLSSLTTQFSPGQHLRFERLSLEEGISQSTVFSMLQDSQGFMWFGTEDGLNKYDDYTFTVYKHDPEDPNSLGGNWIQAMLKDDSGALWK
jgi:hypothetical protein